MQKVVHFRQIEWIGQNHNIVQLISDALAVRPNVVDTTSIIGAETSQVKHRDIKADAICLHFDCVVPGAKKGISPNAIGVPAADLGEAAAPPNSEFTEKEIALVVRQNALAFVGSGAVRDRLVERVIRALLAAQHGPNIANAVTLIARANENLVQRILAEGVTYLDLGLALPTAEALGIVEEQPHGIVGSVRNALQTALSERLHDDLTEDEIETLAQSSTRLQLKVQKKSQLELIQGLTDIAGEAIETDEDFKIKTAKGNSYSRDQLLIRRMYNQQHSTFLDYARAWQEARMLLDAVQ